MSCCRQSSNVFCREDHCPKPVLSNRLLQHRLQLVLSGSDVNHQREIILMKKLVSWLIVLGVVALGAKRLGLVNFHFLAQDSKVVQNASGLLASLYSDTLAPLLGLPTSPTPEQGRTIPVGQALAVGYDNNLTIRIDSIRILRSDRNLGLGGEAVFAILATRDNGAFRSSRKLLAPGTGAFPVKVGDFVDLGDFSLQVNHVADDDRIEVFFIGLENDDLSAELGMVNDTLDVILNVLVDTVVPLTTGVPGLALEALSGEALTWWREQDLLGEYKVVLEKSNNWQEGSRYTVESTNGNLEIVYTILRSTERLQPTAETVTLTVENQSAWAVYTVFVWPAEGETWRNKIRQSIQPGESLVFALEAGRYNLRAEADRGLYWEQSAVEITRERTGRLFADEKEWKR